MREKTPQPIAAGNPGPMTGPGNTTWLLDGAEPTLIDAGVGAASHVDAIAHALAGRPLHRVIVTHGHADHASGVPALRARWPSIAAHKWIERGDAGAWTPLHDGETLRAGDRALQVIYTPGHAIDHVSLWDAQTRDVFTGDLLVLGTTVMIPAGRGGNLRDYLASLARIDALDPARALPGHGPIIEQPRALIAEYVAHRQMRERQVLEALAAGVTDVDGIVARIYPSLADALKSAARMTVEAHVEKIRTDAVGQ
jgi:glyoxylase-like metal-dependent hydrolase (beta-lactamase superfamily II)